MARLEPLIKVRKHAVDEKQRALAELYRQAEELQRLKDELLMNLAKEQALADMSSDLETRATFGPYAAAVRDRIESLDVMMGKMDVRINMAQDAMRDAFAELKKIEITDRERKTRDQREKDSKAAKEQDEMAITRHQSETEKD
jgi:flagellar protein FliJ